MDIKEKILILYYIILYYIILYYYYIYIYINIKRCNYTKFFYFLIRENQSFC